MHKVKCKKNPSTTLGDSISLMASSGNISSSSSSMAFLQAKDKSSPLLAGSGEHQTHKGKTGKAAVEVDDGLWEDQVLAKWPVGTPEESGPADGVEEISDLVSGCGGLRINGDIEGASHRFQPGTAAGGGVGEQSGPGLMQVPRIGGFWLMATVFMLRGFNPRNFEQAMIGGWNPIRAVVMTVVAENLFRFWFEYRLDINKVLREGPWRFKDFPVAVLEVEENVIIPRESLTLVPFWIQIFGAPPSAQSQAFARYVGSLLGQVLDADGTVRRQVGSEAVFIRTRVNMDMTVRLPRGTSVIVDDKNRPLAFKFERLFNFCYACGMVNHTTEDCDALLQHEGTLELPFGEWLKGFPPRSGLGTCQGVGGNPFAVNRQQRQIQRYAIPGLPPINRPRPALTEQARPVLSSVENRMPLLPPPGFGVPTGQQDSKKTAQRTFHRIARKADGEGGPEQAGGGKKKRTANTLMDAEMTQENQAPAIQE